MFLSVCTVHFALQEADQIAHGADGGGLLLGELVNAELLFQGHGQVYDIHRVGVQVIGKGGLHGDGILVHIELLGNERFQFFKDHTRCSFIYVRMRTTYVFFQYYMQNPRDCQ